MPTAVQWLTSDRTSTKYRIYDVLGSDAALRTEVVDTLVQRLSPAEIVRVTVGSGDGEHSTAQVWDIVKAAPLIRAEGARLLIVSEAQRLQFWGPLRELIDDRARFADVVLVLVSDRAQQGWRERDPQSLPGQPIYKTVLAEWEQWLKDYSSATSITCSTPSIDVDNKGVSQVSRWLSRHLVVTQRQAEYLWSRTGQSTALAGDVVEQLARAAPALGRSRDARDLALPDFQRLVDGVVTMHGPEELVDLILFGRKQLALASIRDQEFESSKWRGILGLLSQRLDWLAPLHDALATNEDLQQVQRRLSINRKWILTYAHREDPKHNIAKQYNQAKVARCRQLLALLDDALESQPGVPPGLGEVLIASW